MIVTLVLMTGDPDVTILPNEVIIQITDDDCKSIAFEYILNRSTCDEGAPNSYSYATSASAFETLGRWLSAQ